MSALADDLKPNNRIHESMAGGAARLLRDLIKGNDYGFEGGLPERSVPVAALLVLELDRPLKDRVRRLDSRPSNSLG